MYKSDYICFKTFYYIILNNPTYWLFNKILLFHELVYKNYNRKST
jgi:hypothetical protein